MRSLGEIPYPDGREHDSAFTTSAEGITFDRSRSTPRRSRYSTEISIDEQLMDQFTKILADRIESERSEGTFHHLVLVSESKFAGHLKQKLSSSTLKLFLKIIPRDVIHEDSVAIEERVRKELKEHPEILVE